MIEDTFGNGIKAVIRVSEKFKPIAKDEVTSRAKRLIHFTESLNSQISEESQQMGQDFVKLARAVTLISAYDKTLAVLSLVPPYYDYHELVINIRSYQTSEDALRAFKTAVLNFDKNDETLTINLNVKKMISAKRAI